MKKLFLIVAALFVAVSFSACSDDDDNKNALIVGTWMIIECQESHSEPDHIWPTDNNYYTYTFNDNGTLILKWYDGSNEVYNYTYSIKGDMLTMEEKNRIEPVTHIYQIKELTKSRLVLFSHWVNDKNNVYEEETLTYKKI